MTAGVMTGMFIAALEATVVGTAMPTVIASLGGLNRYSWVFSAYLVTSTVTVPVWALFLPKPIKSGENDVEGERMIMAEQANVNARDQPVAERN